MAGLGFHAPAPGGPQGSGFDETAYYRFDEPEVSERLVPAARELHDMGLAAVDTALNDEYWLTRLRIPAVYRDQLRRSWERDQCALLGRIDLAFDGNAPPKLLGYQSEVQDGLLDAAVSQRLWFAGAERELGPGFSQFNAIHDGLVREIGLCVPHAAILHIAGMTRVPADAGALKYFYACAQEASVAPRVLDMRMIGHEFDGQLCDPEGYPIRFLYKHYPWEWMFAEDYAGTLRLSRTVFFEPAWTHLLGHGGLLALLWNLFPNHPNLLPAFLADDPRGARPRIPVRRPFYRLGPDARISNPEIAAWRARELREESAHTLIDIQPLPPGARDAVVEVWMVGDAACGMSVREEDGQGSGAAPVRRFPHAVVDAAVPGRG